MMTLKEYLKTNALKDADFGVLIGVTQSQVSRIKNGTSLPSLQVALAIQKVTDGAVSAESFARKPQAASSEEAGAAA